jgi:hypothetical protein
MYLCIRDQAGAIVLHQNLVAQADNFLKAIEPYQGDLVVGCECMFAWYWVADLCAQEKIDFVLGPLCGRSTTLVAEGGPAPAATEQVDVRPHFRERIAR